MSTRDIVTELEALAAIVSGDAFTLRTRSIPLERVEQGWAEAPNSTDRIVLTP